MSQKWAPILLFLLAHPSLGFGDLPFQKILNPSFNVQQSYESNVFRQNSEASLKSLINDSQKGDFFTKYRAGLKVNIPISKQVVSAQGSKEFVRFFHYKSQSYQNEAFDADAKLTYKKSFFLNPGYRYSNILVSRETNIGRLENEFQKESEIVLGGGYVSGRINFELFYKEKKMSFRINTGRDRNINSFNALMKFTKSKRSSLFVAVTTKNLFFLELGKELNHTETDAWFGGKFGVGGKTNIGLEVGHRKKRFIDSTDRNFSGLVLRVSFFWNITRKTSLYAEYQRDTEISYFENTTFQIIQRPRVDLLWQITPKTASKVFFVNSVAESKGVSGENPLTDQKYLTTGWEGKYMLNTFTDLKIGYKFEKRSSNLEDFEYENRSASVEISFLLD
ncbi:MAG: outer membrane beta-barrel protein [Nitrospinota bacterium]